MTEYFSLSLFRMSHINIYLTAMCLQVILYHIPNGITEKAMAPHSSTLAWRILWTEEPGGLPSMGSHRVGHD